MKNEYHIYGFYSSKTYDRHRLLINLSDKLNLRKSDKCVICHILYMEKYTKTIILKCQCQVGMINLNF